MKTEKTSEETTIMRGIPIPKDEFQKMLDGAEVIDLTTVKDVRSIARPLKP